LLPSLIFVLLFRFGFTYRSASTEYKSATTVTHGGPQLIENSGFNILIAQFWKKVATSIAAVSYRYNAGKLLQWRADQGWDPPKYLSMSCGEIPKEEMSLKFLEVMSSLTALDGA
jgi:hypothetical protein